MNEVKENSVLRKLIFILVLAAGIMLGTAAVCSFAEQTTINGIKYDYDTNTREAYVARDNDTSLSGDITIPSTITVNETTYTVTMIDSSAFERCSNLESITIPESVTTIGNSAFLECSGLTDVFVKTGLNVSNADIQNSANVWQYKELPEAEQTVPGKTLVQIVSVSKADGSATDAKSVACNAMRDNYVIKSVNSDISGVITLTHNCNEVGSTFEYKKNGITWICTILGENGEATSKVSIELKYRATINGAVEIPSTVSNGCYDYTVTTIGKNGLSYGAFTSLTIPPSVNSIGNGAFLDCSSLTNSFTKTGLYIDTSELWRYANRWRYEVLADQTGAPAGKTLVKITSVDKVPGSASNPTSVACNAMGDAYAIRSVEASGVTLAHTCGFVNDTTFEYTDENNVTWTCTILQENGQNTTNVSIVPKDKNSISGEITIPSTVTNHCLGSFTVTTIGVYAFDGCSGLESITIPSSVDYINYFAFNGCSGLTSVTIPSSVTSMGDFVFASCSGLAEINVDTNNSNYSSEDGILYNKNKTELICCPVGKTGSIEIPSSVTTIRKHAFYQCSSLESITIPEGVTSIGDFTFQNCSGLTKLTIPLSVTYIGDIFIGCTSLTNVFIPNSATVGRYAFDGLSADVWWYKALADQSGAPAGKTLVEIVSVDRVDGSSSYESSAESIACGAMGDGYLIKEIPDGITLTHTCGFVNDTTFEYTDENNATWTCTILQENGQNTTNVSIVPKDKNSISGSVEIPSTVTNDCLGSFTVTEIGIGAFQSCDSLINVTIPAGATAIRDSAFRYCHGLKNVTIPEGVIAIGSNVFQDCGALTSLTIPSSVTTIGSDAVRNCISLTSITIPEDVTAISDRVFYDCKKLTSVTIPKKVTTIGYQAFYRCKSLEDAFVPQNATVNSNAFTGDGSNPVTANVWKYNRLESQEGAPAGKTLVEIVSVAKADGSASTVSSVACGAMGDNYIIRYACVTLTHNCGVQDPTSSPFTVTANGISWSCTVLQGNGQNTTNVSIKPTSINSLSGSVEIPSTVSNGCYEYTVTMIDSFAFERCSNLESITIPESVTTIGNNAFDGCSSLIRVTIPSSVETIGNGAFKACSSLTRVTIPSNVNSIETEAFTDCIHLTDVFVKTGLSISNADIQSSANIWRYMVLTDENSTLTGKIFVNIASVTKANGSTTDAKSVACDAMGDNYVIKSVNSDISDIITLKHNCNEVGSNFEYKKNGITWTCTILEEAANNSAGKVSILPKDKSSISGSVEIPSAVSNGCYEYTVTMIDSFAFERCSNLESITIPESVTTIGNNAFDGCSTLYNVNFVSTQEKPSQLTTIGSYVFYDCGYLDSITIPESVTTIESDAFYKCGLRNVNFVNTQEKPSQLTTIGSYAFCYCSNLGSITIPESVTTIGSSMFSRCIGLTDVFVKTGLNISNADIQSSANIWRYEVLENLNDAPQGKILVKITGKDQGDSTSITQIAMGDSYLIVYVQDGVAKLIKDRILVKITNASVVDSTNVIIPNKIDCDVMGGSYEIDSVENIGINLHNSLQHVEAISATCLESGNIEYWKCDKCGNYYSDENGFNKIDPSTININSIGQHTIEKKDAINPTCTSRGNIDYWICTICGTCFRDAEATQEINIEDTFIEPTGHSWGKVTYEWSEDNNTCIAKRVCENDARHVETKEGIVTTAVTSATCVKAGKITYTATFEEETFETEEQTKEVTTNTDPDAHTWSEVEYEWSEDNSTCTVTGICENDASHVETETVNTSAEIIEPTCTEVGITRYTATFANFGTQIKDVKYIDATGHRLTKTEAVAATCTQLGNTAYWSCSKCGNYYGDENGTQKIEENSWELELTKHVWNKGTVNWTKEDKENEHVIWTCITTKTCAVCGEEETKTDVFVPEDYDYSDDNIPATTRIWKYSVNEGGETATITGIDNKAQFVEVEIPFQIGENGESYQITTIGNNVFQGCSDLTSITIPSSVISIGQMVFYDDYKLQDVYSQDELDYGNVDIPSTTRVWKYTEEGKVNEKIIVNIVSEIGGTKPEILACDAMGDNYAIKSIDESVGVTLSHGESEESREGKAATCREIGYEAETSICKACGLPIDSQNVIPVLDHDWNEEGNWTKEDKENEHVIWTCITTKTCAVCGEEETKTDVFVPEDYDYSDDNIPATTRIWKYSVNEGGETATITGIDNKTQFVEVEIPSRIGKNEEGSYKITSLGENVFDECLNLLSVTIPEGVTEIGRYAFWYCTNLKSIMIPESVTIIEDNTFNNCSSLIIVTIPENVKTIGDFAFANSGLTSVIIPSSINLIGDGVFDGCRDLTEINIGENNNNYSSEDGVLYDKNKTTLICYPAKKNNDTFTIPNSVTTISNYAFYGCSGLTNVTISEGVKSIGDYAFYGCSSLSSVTISEGVTTLGCMAFSNCSGLTNITIPNSVISIESYAFEYCNNLISVTIPKGVTTIGNYVFFSCNNLQDVYIQDGLECVNANIPPTTRVWKYAEEGKLNGKIIVNIVSEIGGTKQETLACNAMGYNYSIKSIDESVGVTLSHGESEESRERKAPTCTEIGYEAETSICKVCGLPIDSENIIPATGHDWNDPTYSWTQENGIWTCTATRVCQNNVSHSEELGTITVSGYSGEYDGLAQGLTVTGEITGSSILYSADEGEDKTWSADAPKYTEIGNYTVYVKIQNNESHRDSDVKSATIKISEHVLLGDINADGSINILDLKELCDHVAGFSELTNEQKSHADLNKDGNINIFDLQILYNIIAIG